MDKKYKAISTIVTQEPGTEYDSETREKRYVLLEENGYTDLPFSSGDLLRYWNKGPVYSRKKRK